VIKANDYKGICNLVGDSRIGNPQWGFENQIDCPENWGAGRSYCQHHNLMWLNSIGVQDLNVVGRAKFATGKSSNWDVLGSPHCWFRIPRWSLRFQKIMGNPSGGLQHRARSNLDLGVDYKPVGSHHCGMGQKQMMMKPPNNRLKLTVPSVHAFCFAAGAEDPGCGAKKRAPRPAA
jgi:hypothetical protein